jgi:L-alanine-DL-glutamate epimerase-like enolase superfamily enzyme
MRIERLEVHEAVQPYQDKDWRFALAAYSENRGLLVRVHTDHGPDGFGYATAALHIGEVIDGMRHVVQDVFAPILVGSDPFDVEALMGRVDQSVLGYSRTKASIEVAICDVIGKTLGVPLYQLWGGLVRESIPVVRIIPIKDPVAMARNAEQVVGDGYRYLKVKVGHDADLDVERVREIRQAVGPEIVLTLDANQGWGTPRVAIEALRRMEDYDIALIEQPVRADDFRGLAEVKAAVHTIVEADESAKSVSDVFKLASMNAVDAISLKTSKLGGPRNVKRAAAICEAANLRCRMGMAGANRLISAVDMHLIASTPNIDFACEVGEFARMEFDPTDGIEIIDGTLSVPHVPGHGAVVREGVLA